MRKWIAILLCLCMVMSLVACTSQDPAPTGDNNNTTEATQGGSDVSQPTEGQKEEGPARVTEPVTIEFWHTFSSGALAEYMNDAVARFNAENEYGITVNALYIGDYGTIRTQVLNAIGAKNNPQVIINGTSNILDETGVLLDMQPYADRDGFDMSRERFTGASETIMYIDGTHLTHLPVQRSASVLYYNKDMFSKAGYDEVPLDFEEFLAAAKKVAQVNNVAGFELMIDVPFYQEALLKSLGEDGICDADLKGASCLEDGNLLKLMTDWRKGIDEGWMIAPTVSSAHDNMYQALYSGNLASFFASSAVLGTVSEYAEKSGINLGLSAMPGYGGSASIGGGGDISIIASNNNENQRAASWEFVKWMMSDEEIATRSKATGYLPVTSGSVELMQEFFAENPLFEIAYEARVNGVPDGVASLIFNDWSTQLHTAFSYLVQDRSMTPEQALDYLQKMTSSVFF